MKTYCDGFTKLRAMIAIAASSACLLIGSPASAVLVATAGVDVVPASPDALMPIAPIMDELGDAAFFPAGEAIAHMAAPTALIACAPTNGVAANALVTIMNTTLFTFANLHYVAATGTTFTNFDGTINGAIAFRIDTTGPNAPLVAASDVGADGLFSPGETWSFIVDDFAGAGPPDGFFTPGVVGGAEPVGSTASIVADVVPEPASLVWFALGALALFRRRVGKA